MSVESGQSLRFRRSSHELSIYATNRTLQPLAPQYALYVNVIHTTQATMVIWEPAMF